ncbi:hypothetical protein EX30DRAFT_56012 [Ascodesmis nigricans]|uniref:Uncharacterized protein n=1 Tax=Ascodesmis nigricans TaxID=341454 RepID=A0A4S2MUN1_9PEZI|nr:hypothetical protein EX30DRAFT_56012 [Ascodesmis nigricans]
MQATHNQLPTCLRHVVLMFGGGLSLLGYRVCASGSRGLSPTTWFCLSLGLDCDPQWCTERIHRALESGNIITTSEPSEPISHRPGPSMTTTNTTHEKQDISILPTSTHPRTHAACDVGLTNHNLTDTPLHPRYHSGFVSRVYLEGNMRVQVANPDPASGNCSSRRLYRGSGEGWFIKARSCCSCCCFPSKSSLAGSDRRTTNERPTNETKRTKRTKRRHV